MKYSKASKDRLGPVRQWKVTHSLPFVHALSTWSWGRYFPLNIEKRNISSHFSVSFFPAFFISFFFLHIFHTFSLNSSLLSYLPFVLSSFVPSSFPSFLNYVFFLSSIPFFLPAFISILCISHSDL